jgi:hypothetical protein
LDSQQDFLAENLTLIGGDRGLNVVNCKDVHFSDLKAGVFEEVEQDTNRTRSKIRVANTTRFYIDKGHLVGGNVDNLQIGWQGIIDNKPSNDQKDTSSIYISKCEMGTQGGSIIYLTGTGSEVVISQCHLEQATEEYIYQCEISNKTLKPALIRLIDCSVSGPEDKETHSVRGMVSISTPLASRFRINHCNFVIRNSPGSGIPTINNYLSVPERNTNNIRQVSAHIDCVDRHIDGITADDPSGLITGNVHRFVKKYSNIATKVESYPISSGGGTTALRYDIDISKGGIKEINVAGQPSGVKIEIINASKVVEGTELFLILMNPGNDSTNIYLPQAFRIHDGETSPLKIGKGGVRVLRFLF